MTFANFMPKTERTKGKCEEKHTEILGTTHAVIERRDKLGARSIDTIKPLTLKNGRYA